MDTIDIIEFTNTQFSLLTMGQLQTVKTAQQQKDRLYKKLQQKLRKEKHKMVKNGVYRSEIYRLLEERLMAEYEKDVAVIKDCLLFYLRYSMKTAAASEMAPYRVDYSLTDEQRMLIVKEFYTNNYPNAVERFELFLQDKVAPQYLGQLYPPLFSYFSAEADRAGAEE